MIIYSKNHRLIYEQHYGPIPKDEFGRTYEVHHIDRNHSNNDPKNLIAVTIQEHYDIHYSQGDYGACQVISIRMETSPEEISKLAKLAMDKRVADKTNHHLREDYKAKIKEVHDLRVQNGTHHTLTKEWSEYRSEHNRKLIEEGTHVFVKNNPRKDPSQKHKFTGKNHHRFDHNIYCFENSNTGEKIIGTRQDFLSKVSVPSRNFQAVVKGKRKSVLGWRVSLIVSEGLESRKPE